MTLTLRIPDDIASEARSHIQELDGVVTEFLRIEVARRRYHSWREERYSPEAKQLVEKAIQRADQNKRQTDSPLRNPTQDFHMIREELLNFL